METPSLKHWAQQDRPREKLLTLGAAALSDAELLAILLGSGSRNETAVELARRILHSQNNDLQQLGRIRLNDLQNFKGMGTAKSVSVMAALELGRRKGRSESAPRARILCSKDAFQQLSPAIADLDHEEFWILLLNRANEVTGIRKVSEGGFHATVVDPKKVFLLALESRASAIIAAHNHPSGQLTPSAEDKQLTLRLQQSGKLLDCLLLDHLIISAKGYYSFADEGSMEL